ncbi:hypothetical protein F441_07526, partial [Phytophthora nicotianae CJ01A1]
PPQRSRTKPTRENLMRFTQFLMVATASFFLASDVSSMTADLNQDSRVASPANPSQRLLRVHHAAIEADSEDEERSLTTREMKKMMKNLTTKEEFASTLGISQLINSDLNGGALMRFMQSSEYLKYRAYMDFLNDMAKNSKYKDLVRQIKAK